MNRHFVAKLADYYRGNRMNAVIATVVVVVVMVAGSVLFLTKAATTVVSTEAEMGTKSAPATQVADATASGGQAVKFTAASTGSCPVTTANVPGGPDGMGGCFPGSGNTGVPAGTVLSSYTGGCSITSGTVTVTAKNIAAACPNFYVSGSATVTVTNSSFNTVQVTGTGAHLTITDSDINGGSQSNQAAIGVWNGPTDYGFTGLRLDVQGGKDGLECDLACSLSDSWLHSWANPPNGAHMQAFLNSGGGANSHIYLSHNSMDCKVYVAGDSGGCTADVSLFGDGGVVSQVTVDKNLLINGNGYQTYCAALGYNPGKNYPNPDHVVFTNNVLQRGASGFCGDNSNTAFWKRASDGATGNIWSNNKLDNGTIIPEPISG